jgi:hypothetical protein
MAANIGTSGADVWRMNLRQFPAIRILKIGVNGNGIHYVFSGSFVEPKKRDRPTRPDGPDPRHAPRNGSGRIVLFQAEISLETAIRCVCFQ